MPQKVNAIANGYEILKKLATQETDHGVTAIAKQTGISPSSCFNILRTLVDLGLAKFDEKSKGYSLGLGIFELARTGLAQNPVLAGAQPVLVTLAQKYNATLGLWDIVHDSRAVLLALGENSSQTRLHHQIGSRQPVGAGATGKAYLSAHTNDTDWLRARFSEVNWEGPITFDAYVRDINRAKEVGYAIDRDNYYAGVSAVSVAFSESASGRRYCVTAVLLSGAHDDASLAAIGRDMHAAVAQFGEPVVRV